MPAKKSAKKAAKKSAKKAAKPTAKKAPSKAAAKPAEKTAEETPEPAADAAAGDIKAADVNLGHIFALRPRVATSFKQNDFRTAKQQLDEKRYSSLTDAARAVAEKALELTTDGPPGSRRRRRW